MKLASIALMIMMSAATAHAQKSATHEQEEAGEATKNASALAAALKEVLLAIRALIDWYLERIERRRAEPADVEDIPIA